MMGDSITREERKLLVLTLIEKWATVEDEDEVIPELIELVTQIGPGTAILEVIDFAWATLEMAEQQGMPSPLETIDILRNTIIDEMAQGDE